MNNPVWCNFCSAETETKEWVCVVCDLSKGHPE